jgi:arylsulfatase A-like enzyme
MDLLPTFAGLAEVPLPGDRKIDGVDLLPVVKVSGRDNLERALFWRIHHQKAVRRGSWKLLVDESQGLVRLYHLGSDVSETRDLSGKEPARVQSLLDELELWEQDKIEPAWPYVMSFRLSAEGGELFFPL